MQDIATVSPTSALIRPPPLGKAFGAPRPRTPGLDYEPSVSPRPVPPATLAVDPSPRRAVPGPAPPQTAPRQPGDWIRRRLGMAPAQPPQTPQPQSGARAEGAAVGPLSSDMAGGRWSPEVAAGLIQAAAAGAASPLAGLEAVREQVRADVLNRKNDCE
jgi:hypothetical protein